VVKYGNGLCCELYLKVDYFSADYTSLLMEIYTILMVPCPKGFKI